MRLCKGCLSVFSFAVLRLISTSIMDLLLNVCGAALFSCACAAGADAFLLESIFRNEVWEHMQLPVSEENERCCYQQLIDGCTAALAGYPTSIDEDLALLNGYVCVCACA